MQYRLRTLLIVMAIGPPLLAWFCKPVLEWFDSPSREQLRSIVQTIPPDPDIYNPFSDKGYIPLRDEDMGRWEDFNPSDWILPDGSSQVSLPATTSPPVPE
jgi:hypothetical protein